MHELELANDQLRRMRGMNRYYHQRFFSDTRTVAIVVLGLFVVGFVGIVEAFLLHGLHPLSVEPPGFHHRDAETQRKNRPRRLILRAKRAEKIRLVLRASVSLW